MQRFEFKVLPAPKRGAKARGVKTTEDRFALAMTNLMNEMGAEGWDYVRADALPCEERVGFTGTKTNYLNMLVFRRLLPNDIAGRPTLLLGRPEAEEPGPRRLGPAEAPLPGKAPAVGPAIPSDLEDPAQGEMPDARTAARTAAMPTSQPAASKA